MTRTGLIVLGCTLAPIAHGFLLIDDFTTGPYHNAIASGASSASQAASVPGGSRLISWSIDNNPFPSQLTIDAAGGIASIGNGPGMGSRVEFTYGNSSSNPLNANLLSSGSAFEIQLSYNEWPLTLRMFLYSSTYGGYLPTYQTTLAGGSSTTTVGFADFGVGTSSFADIDEVHFQFQNAPSGDYVISHFTVVPEPASMAAIALGLVGIVTRRRSRR